MNLKQLSELEATANVHGLMKWLYSNLFRWIIATINFNSSTSGASAAKLPSKFIGILDIFGFEILTTNSFEQLCINFTNEVILAYHSTLNDHQMLQQHFNEEIFKAEQEVYIADAISWQNITYQNNQPVIDCISKKPSGLLLVLEQHALMNRSPDDLALVASFNSFHDNKSGSGMILTCPVVTL